MVDSIEKRIDVPAGAEGSEKRKEYIPAKPISPEIEEEDINTIDLETAYDQTEGKKNEKNNEEEKVRNLQLDPEEEIAINQRTQDPKVRQGIISSVLNTKDDIYRKSIDPKENRIARFFGKIMNIIQP